MATYRHRLWRQKLSPSDNAPRAITLKLEELERPDIRMSLNGLGGYIGSITPAEIVKTINMKIGIDFDGTIADTNQIKSRWIQDQLGISVPPYMTDRTSCIPIIGKENYKLMGISVYSPDSTANLAPVPGALDAIERLKQNHSILIITARTRNKLRPAEEWLASHRATVDLEVLSVKVSEKSKVQVCLDNHVNALVDDDEGHLVGLEDTGIAAILFKRNAPTPNNSKGQFCYFCRSWEEIEQQLNSMSMHR